MHRETPGSSVVGAPVGDASRQLAIRHFEAANNRARADAAKRVDTAVDTASAKAHEAMYAALAPATGHQCGPILAKHLGVMIAALRLELTEQARERASLDLVERLTAEAAA